MLIRKMQEFARTRNLRISFISGDVHVGGLGRLYSNPKMDLRKDFRYMPQVWLSTPFVCAVTEGR